jgi:hypothetical protein
MKKLSVAVLVAILCEVSGIRAISATYRADAFVDSVGVNVHMHYDDTAYVECDTVLAKLQALKVRHVRDGMTDTIQQWYYDCHETFGAAGIGTTFIMDNDTSGAVIANYPTRVPLSFEAYEGPNEDNITPGDMGWEVNTLADVVRLRANALGGYPVIAPSLTTPEAYDLLGDIGAYVDYANLHNYADGRHPEILGWGDDGYGSIEHALRVNAARQAPGKPVMTTENGYYTDSAVSHYVTEAVMTRYAPRLLLEHFQYGIFRTFWYELIDFPNPPSIPALTGYGLIEQDYTNKDAYTAIQSLLTLLDDPGNTKPVDQLGYSLTGAGATVNELAFHKGNGSFFLALWLEGSMWNVDTAMLETPIAGDSLTVNLTGKVIAHRLHTWQADGSVVITPVTGNPAEVSVTVTDTLQILEILPVPARVRRL